MVPFRNIQRDLNQIKYNKAIKLKVRLSYLVKSQQLKPIPDNSSHTKDRTNKLPAHTQYQRDYLTL